MEPEECRVDNLLIRPKKNPEELSKNPEVVETLNRLLKLTNEKIPEKLSKNPEVVEALNRLLKLTNESGDPSLFRLIIESLKQSDCKHRLQGLH